MTGGGADYAAARAVDRAERDVQRDLRPDHRGGPGADASLGRRSIAARLTPRRAACRRLKKRFRGLLGGVELTEEMDSPCILGASARGSAGRVTCRNLPAGYHGPWSRPKNGSVICRVCCCMPCAHPSASARRTQVRPGRDLAGHAYLRAFGVLSSPVASSRSDTGGKMGAERNTFPVSDELSSALCTTRPPRCPGGTVGLRPILTCENLSSCCECPLTQSTRRCGSAATARTARTAVAS